MNRFGGSAFMYAAARGDGSVVGQLIEAGAEINAANNNGVTPLMLASGNGHEAIALQLLDAGADPRAVNKWGRSALQEAEARRLRWEGRAPESYVGLVTVSTLAGNIRRCVELLKQPRVPIAWTPATHTQFPKCSRVRAAGLGALLLRHRVWNAEAVPVHPVVDNQQVVRDAWLDFIPRHVSEAVAPMSRGVAGM